MNSTNKPEPQPLTYKEIKKAIDMMKKKAGKPPGKVWFAMPGKVVIADTYEEMKQKVEEFVKEYWPDEAAEE